MSFDFYIGQSDLLPSVSSTLLDSDDAAIDLTGCSVAFTFQIGTGNAPGKTAAAVVVTALAGTVRYDWAVGDTAVPGEYHARWVVTYPSGKKESFPNGSYHRILVSPSVGASP